MGLTIFLLGIPSAYSLTGNLKIAGKDFLDAADFLASNILLPLGGLFIALFVGWIWTEGARKEVSNDGTYHFSIMEAWIWVCRTIAPIAIAIIFWQGLRW